MGLLVSIKREVPTVQLLRQTDLPLEKGEREKTDQNARTGVRALPRDATSAKFSSITSWYRSLWASPRSLHSSWEKYTATSSKVTGPWDDGDSVCISSFSP